MFDPEARAGIAFSADEGPYLLVIIDAEEEFDWRIVPSPSTSVATIKHQIRAQRIFDRYGIVPTYAVDYPVASQREGWEPLLEFLRDGRCEIGAQLHPWVNPPTGEAMVERNTYPGNLPAELEYEKLKRLTAMIEESFGIRPTVYRAGRFGAGPNTADILARLGYEIDCSILPWTDLRYKYGPDYRRSTVQPYWFGPQQNLLEIPVTLGMVGLLASAGESLYPMISAAAGEKMKLTALFARLRLLDRIRLTPEGSSLDEAKRLTRALLNRDQHRVFVLTYHSPSLDPGHTPYVRSAADLDAFLAWIEEYLAFFFGELGGQASTPPKIRQRAIELRAAAAPAAF